MQKHFLKVSGLYKDFSGVEVLKGVDLGFRPGEIHALLGENGAGKSTLIKILTGVYHASAGKIEINGRVVHNLTPAEANVMGVGAVYQDAELAWNLSVAENLLLGSEPGWISRRKMYAQAAEMLQQIGLDIDPRARAGSLSAAQMQMLTLATLFHRNFKLIILDEPTARLSGQETEILFSLIRRFRAEDIAIVYISHRLKEVKALCDKATILRDGKVVRTLDQDEIEEALVTELMINRKASELDVKNTGHARKEIALEVRGLSTPKLAPIDLTLHKGEIIGVTGPVGGGMEQIEKALTGLTAHAGEIRVNGAPVEIGHPTDALDAGIALIPEDRRKQALFPELSLADNVALPVLERLQNMGIVGRGAKIRNGREIIEKLHIFPSNPATKMRYFSGGNQQKAVIGKWLNRHQSVYIFSEPTSGVDVGAIRQIYDIILDLARNGAAILLLSTTLKELLALSDRIIVVHGGRVLADGPCATFDRDRLLSCTLGNDPLAQETADAI